MNKFFRTGRRLNSRTVHLADGRNVHIQDPELLVVPILGHDGQQHQVECIEMPTFDRTPLQLPIWPKSEPEFSNTTEPHKKTVRPDLLLGTNASACFPDSVRKNNSNGNNYQILRSALTGKFLLQGIVASSKSENCHKLNKVSTRNLSRAEETFFRQLEAEDINPSTARPAAQLTAKMAEELAKCGVNFSEERQQWISRYWYNEELLDKLEPNRERVEKRMRSMLKSVRKIEGLPQTLQEICEKNIETGVWSKLSNSQVTEDMKKHYLPINHVFNESSTSTPVRIITDSSFTGRNGLSLNMTQLKGENNIGNLRQTLLLVRCSPTLAAGDLSKFYHSFALLPRDQSLRRLLIPKDWTNENSELEEIVEATMPFGDQNAGSLAVIGRIKNAERNSKEVAPQLQERVLQIYRYHSYVDDVFGFAYPGENIQDVISELTAVAEKGGFHFKEWTKTGDQTDTKLLGYTWLASEDILKLKLWFNISESKRGKKSEANLDLENLDELLDRPISKRQVLMLNGQFFDPLNIFSPAVIKLRLLYSIVNLEVGHSEWEKTISSDLKYALKSTLEEILPLKNFSIPRFVGQSHCFSKSGSLIIFCDGSLVAFGAVAYWRPGSLDEKSTAQIICSSVGICNRKKTTAPRSELLAACKATDLYLSMCDSLEKMFTVDQIFFITDSRVVLGQLLHSGGKFNIFTGSRIDKIQNSIEGHPWYWTPGPSNPADLLTRGTATFDEITSPFWLNGNYIGSPIKDWPIQKVTEVTECLPDVTVKCRFAKTTATTTPEVPQPNTITLTTAISSHPWKIMPEHFKKILNRTSSLQMGLRLLKVWVYYVHRVVKQLRIEYPVESTNFYDLTHQLLLQWDEINQEAAPKLSGYTVQTINGIHYVRGRQVGSLPPVYLPILRATSTLGNLILRDAHNQWGHDRSVRSTAARVMERYYIIRASATLRKIRKQCYTCKFLAAKPLEVSIGPVPTTQVEPSGPFTHIMVDIFGPFFVFDQVKRRTTLKVWGLLVLCQFSRAVRCYVLQNYSADAVCQALTRHVANNGQFKSFWSDKGTQLTAAGKIMLGDEENVRLDCSTTLTRQFPDVEWKHGPPSSPWVQGGAEVLIREVKKSLKIHQLLQGTHKLTVLEFDTMLCRISQFLNNRPLILGPEVGDTLTPSHLTCTSRIPPPDLHSSPSPLLRRKQMIDDAFKEFYNRFIRSRNLKKTFKFGNQSDKLQPGDIVLILDKPSPLGWYKAGIVKEVKNPRRIIVEVNKNRLLERHIKTLSKLIDCA